MAQRVVQRVAIVLLAGAMGLAAWCGQAAAAESPTCAVAQHLLSAHHPQQSLDLIAAAREDAGVPTTCAAVESLAAQQVVSAGRLAAAEDVLAVDADNAEGKRIQSVALIGVEKFKDAQRSDPLRRLPADESRWKDFTKTVLTPASTLLVAGLTIALAMVVAGRLLLLIWPFRWPRVRRMVLCAITGLGVAILVGGVLSPWWLDPQHPTIVGASALGFAVGAVVWAVVLGSRMRLTVQVRDSDGKVDDGATTQLVALLSEFGGKPPRGLEVPVGPDVETLTGKAITDVKAGWLAAALTVLQAVLGVTPWRVVVDLRENGDAYAVATRNGRSAGSAKIDATPLKNARLAEDGLPVAVSEWKVDPIVMAAAFVLLTLDAGYASGFEALAGAREWQSVGWQYEASRPSTSREAKIALLSRAIQRDPGNLPAQMALQFELYRREQDDDVLERYEAWLVANAASTVATDNPYLRLRLLHSATAVALNRHEMRERWSRQGSSRSAARAIELSEQLKRQVRQLKRADPFRVTLEPVAQVLSAVAKSSEVPYQVTTMLGSPTLDFDLACFYASRSQDRQALDRLASTMARPDGRAMVLADPFLQTLAASASFRTRYPGTARTDWLTLDIVSENAVALRSAGLDTPALFNSATENMSGLADYLGGQLVLDRLVGLARMTLALPLTLADLRVEIVAILIDEGMFQLSDLRGRPMDEVVDAVTTALENRLLAMDAAQLASFTSWTRDYSR